MSKSESSKTSTNKIPMTTSMNTGPSASHNAIQSEYGPDENHPTPHPDSISTAHSADSKGTHSGSEQMENYPTPHPVSRNARTSAADPEVIHGEYELAENIATPQHTASVPAEELPPRYQDFQHPYVKVWVRLIAISSLSFLIFNGYVTITEQYTGFFKIFVESNDRLVMNATPFQTFELVLRIYLEMVNPTIIILFFLLTNIGFSAIPKLAMKIHDPTPVFASMTGYVLIYNAITYLGCSLSMVTNLSSTPRTDVWTQYIKFTFIGLFWMYAFINMQVYSKLTIFDQVRAKEKYETRELARAQAHA